MRTRSVVGCGGFAERAGLVRAHFTRCAVALDVELGAVLPAGSGVADALEAIAVAARAWVLRFGPGEAWRIASVLSGGVLLATRAPAYPWAWCAEKVPRS